MPYATHNKFDQPMFWQDRFLWQRLLQTRLDFLHLQRPLRHPTLQLQCIKPCPLPIDSAATACLTLNSEVVGTSSSETNTFLLHFSTMFLARQPFSFPCLVPILKLPCAVSSVTTPIKVGGSAGPRSTLGTSTRTLSPTCIVG